MELKIILWERFLSDESLQNNYTSQNKTSLQIVIIVSLQILLFLIFVGKKNELQINVK